MSAHKWLFAPLFLLCLMPCHGVGATPSENLSDLAKKELRYENEKTPSMEPKAGTVQARIKTQPKQKPSHWSIAAGYQQLLLSGIRPSEFIQQQNLSTSSEPIHFFSLGVKHNFIHNNSIPWSLGVTLGTGRTTSTAVSESERSVRDLQIQAFMGRLDLAANFYRYKGWLFFSSLSAGILNATQVSSNTSARWSETQTVISPGLGLGYLLSPKLQIHFEYKNHIFPAEKAVSSTTHNYRLFLEYLLL